MKTTELVPGVKVDIRIPALEQKQKAEEKVYYSTIYDINQDGTIDIYVPMKSGKLLLLPRNVRCEFSFPVNQIIYQTQGVILDNLKKGTCYLSRIKLLAPLKKIQRREYYRLQCMLPLMFIGIDEIAASYQTIEEVKGYTDAVSDLKVRGIGTILDISGGGARFISSVSLEHIPYICMNFTVLYRGEEVELQIVAKIIRSEKKEEENKYIHRVKFEYKNKHTKDTIIGYVFEEERRIRKKEQGI